MTSQQEFALSHPCLKPEQCAQPSYGWRVDVSGGYVWFFLTVCVLADSTASWMASASLHLCETNGVAASLPLENWTEDQTTMVRRTIREVVAGVGEYSGQCWDSREMVMVLDRDLTSEENWKLHQSLSTKKLKD